MVNSLIVLLIVSPIGYRCCGRLVVSGNLFKHHSGRLDHGQQFVGVGNGPEVTAAAYTLLADEDTGYLGLRGE